MRWTLSYIFGVIMRHTKGENNSKRGASKMNDNVIAIDLAKTVFQICKVDGKGKVLSNKKVSREHLIDTLHKEKQCKVVMEACYSSHYWARTFLAYGHEVKLLPAQHVSPFRQGNKNDKNDALAIYEASNRPNINPVPIKNEEQQAIQSLHRIRDKLISDKVGLTNQVRGLLSEFGVITSQGENAIKRLLAEVCSSDDKRIPEILKTHLDDLREQFTSIKSTIKKIEESLAQYAKSNPLCQLLLTLPGIGLINATALISSIGNGRQFDDARDFAVWLGLTPKQYSSGNKSVNSGVTKRGNRYLRKQLIHGARAALFTRKKVDKPIDKVTAWSAAVLKRRGTNIATVALAAKMARIIWTMLKNNECYKPNYA